MRVTAALVLLPLALGENLVIPAVEALVRDQLAKFGNYTTYDGPSDTAVKKLVNSKVAKDVKEVKDIIQHNDEPEQVAQVVDAGGKEASNAARDLIEPRAATAYWYETITKQGKAAFNTNANYKVYRNVKDYGAVGYEYIGSRYIELG